MKKWQFGVALTLVFFVALFFRIFISLLGSNYDFESYLIVGEILNAGGNVYEQTTRYNYAPIWMNIIQILYTIADANPIIFRYLLIILLSSADYGIFIFLLRKYGWKPSLIFIFNPVSIIITGYHNQFDNLAIFIGFIAVTLLQDNFEKPLTIKSYFGLFLLGISISTKHVLFFIPIWLMVKYKTLPAKLLVASIPIIIFALTFMPYWKDSSNEIISNVFLYKSYKNSLFYYFPVNFITHSEIIWLSILTAFAFLLASRDNVETVLNYLTVLVLTSPAITNQYLAIPVSYLATHINLFGFLYFLTSTIHLSMDYDGLYLYKIGTPLSRSIAYTLSTILLLSSFIFTNKKSILINKLMEIFERKSKAG